MTNIDCHIHSVLSHHGHGTLREATENAIEKGLDIIGFTEHAPHPFDHAHRLTESETLAYLKDLSRLQKEYADRIIILRGLEVDYFRPCAPYTKTLLANLSYDFALGAIHFIELGGERCAVWDYGALQHEQTTRVYFEALIEAISSGFFELIAHPDLILRAGVTPDVVSRNMATAIQMMSHRKIGYEVNCSGITKDKYDPIKKQMVEGPSYPDLKLAAHAYTYGIPLSIGSDAHESSMVGANIHHVLYSLAEVGVGEVAYFINHSAIPVFLTP